MDRMRSIQQQPARGRRAACCAAVNLRDRTKQHLTRLRPGRVQEICHAATF